MRIVVTILFAAAAILWAGLLFLFYGSTKLAANNGMKVRPFNIQGIRIELKKPDEIRQLGRLFFVSELCYSALLIALAVVSWFAFASGFSVTAVTIMALITLVGFIVCHFICRYIQNKELMKIPSAKKAVEKRFKR